MPVKCVLDSPLVIKQPKCQVLCVLLEPPLAMRSGEFEESVRDWNWLQRRHCVDLSTTALDDTLITREI
jgi:hypothetical protein